MLTNLLVGPDYASVVFVGFGLFSGVWYVIGQSSHCFRSAVLFLCSNSCCADLQVAGIIMWVRHCRRTRKMWPKRKPSLLLSLHKLQERVLRQHELVGLMYGEMEYFLQLCGVAGFNRVMMYTE